MQAPATLSMCFVDFKKAFDSISHDKLWMTMMGMEYPLHLMDWQGTVPGLRCMQARKTTHGLNGQHQYGTWTGLSQRVSRNDGAEMNGESTSIVWPTP